MGLMIVDAVLGDSKWDASGGRKSLARSKLQEILRHQTQAQIAKRIRCSQRFVSMMAAGQRKPGNWRLVRRIRDSLGISENDWDVEPLISAAAL